MSDYRIIFTRPEDGGLSIIIPAPGVAREDAARAVPRGLAYEVVPASSVPIDRTFRDAWELNGSDVVHNLEKSKAIAHGLRRAARALEFAPLDVKATIPDSAIEAEASRQEIREKYDAMQATIDAATTVEQLKAAAAALRRPA